MTTATVDVTLESFNTYVQRLAKADWHYEFSDDNNVYATGKNRLDALKFDAASHPMYRQAYEVWHIYVFDTKRTLADVVHRDQILNEIRTELLITC